MKTLVVIIAVVLIFYMLFGMWFDNAPSGHEDDDGFHLD